VCKGKPFFQNTQELSKEKRLQTVHKQFTKNTASEIPYVFVELGSLTALPENLLVHARAYHADSALALTEHVGDVGRQDTEFQQIDHT
jgi:hypothetical protein